MRRVGMTPDEGTRGRLERDESLFFKLANCATCGAEIMDRKLLEMNESEQVWCASCIAILNGEPR